MFGSFFGVLPTYEKGSFASGPSFHQYFNKSFVVEPRQLEEITDTMRNAHQAAFPGDQPSLAISARTPEGTREFNDLGALLENNNPATNKISDIKLKMSSQQGEMTSFVEFKDHTPGWSIAVVVEGGEESQSQGLFANLKQRVGQTFKWYSFVLSNRFWANLVVASIAVFIVTLVAPSLAGTQSGTESTQLPAIASTADALPSGAMQSSPSDPSNPFMSDLNWAVLAAICVISILLGFELLPHSFPKAAYLIGDGVGRYQTVRTWRYALLLVLIAGPVVLTLNI